MALTSGSRFGPYEVLAPLGAGGMGEVYRARDTRLDRDVAIKILPEAFAADPERLARFEREAKTLASLNHPHIAQIYGLEPLPGGGRALVMELVDGEDLSARIARGAIPIDEALPIARQIADALEAAHERGVIHRDLKPANIKVRDDGTVKVLDFGLAKALAPEGANATADLMNSPTITSPAAMTGLGVILGTAAYMSPEQAKGKAVDRSADLWAFGALLYEMLSGKPAFNGETVTDVLAAIVTRDPDWRALPSGTPPAVARLVRRCLDRDRRRRLADAGEARFLIEEVVAAPAGEDAPARRPSFGGRARLVTPWAVAAALAIALAAIAWPRAPAPGARMTHISLETPRAIMLRGINHPAISIAPDGRSVAFTATESGIDRLYIRSGGDFDARVLEGSEGATHPVFSPDGRWVAFFVGSKLIKMPVAGGPLTTLAEANVPRGLSWPLDDALLMTPTTVSGVVRVPAAGGPVEAVTTPVPDVERTHRWPQLLPGGKAVLFTVGSFDSPDNYYAARIDAQVLATGERKTLIAGAEMARYAPTGHLVFARAGSLFAVTFDPETLAVGDVPVPVLQGVSGDATTGASHFDISPTGTLAFLPASGNQALTRPAWVDRDGRIEYLDVPSGAYTDPALSPDGRRVALSVIAGGGRDIWLYDFDRKRLTRATFSGQNATPLWSHDGSTIYFVAIHAADQKSTIWQRAADGSRAAEALVALPHRAFLNAISPDGRAVFYDFSSAASEGSDIGRVALEKGATPDIVLNSVFEEYGSRLSPDGRWLAYASTESSRPEVYVRGAAAGASGRWQVSTTGGEEPRWSKDGRTLYFIAGTLLMAVPIDAGPSFEYGLPVPALTNVLNARLETAVSYDVHADGRVFMIRMADEQASTNTIRLIVDWFDELRKIGAGR